MNSGNGDRRGRRVTVAALGTFQDDVPGQHATTVDIADLMNSLPFWTLKCKCAFRGFLLSILDVPRRQVQSPITTRSSPLWPIAVPYPEVFVRKEAGRVQSLQFKRLVSIQVAYLSWLSLGCPHGAPASLALGSKLTAKQWSVVKYLQKLSRDDNLPAQVDAAFMARSAAKVESNEKIIAALARAAAFLKEGEKNYFGDVLSRPDDPEQTLASRAGKVVGMMDKDGVPPTARPLVASRLVFPGPPSFEPSSLMDPATRALFERPLDFSKSLKDVDVEIPRVRVFASRDNRVELYKMLAVSGRLKPVLVEHKRGGLVSGLFSVPKDELSS